MKKGHGWKGMGFRLKEWIKVKKDRSMTEAGTQTSTVIIKKCIT